LLLTLAVPVLMVLPLLSVGPVADRINERLETITELRQDKSFRARVEFYEEFVPVALSNPVGAGFGSTGGGTKLSADGKEVGELGEIGSVDSGILELPYILGWPGALLYLSGLAWLLYYAFRSRSSTDFVAVASCGIVLGILVQLPFNDKTDGVEGMLLWFFAGLAIAAGAYRDQALRGDKSEAAREPWHGGRHVGREGVAGSRLARNPGGFRW
jgi:hypothetical protein